MCCIITMVKFNWSRHMSDKKKKKKVNISLVTWLIAFVGCILFDTVVFRLAFLPLRWRAMIIVGSLAIAMFFLYCVLSIESYKKRMEELLRKNPERIMLYWHLMPF